MDDLELIQKRLANVPASGLAGIAELSGVPVGTLQKIKSGETKNPRFKTVKTLRDFFLRRAA